MMKAKRNIIKYDNSPVGHHLTDAANMFGAVKIRHLGGKKFVAVRFDGTEMRMLTDEGIGSTEFEEGFDDAWETEKNPLAKDNPRRRKVALMKGGAMKIPRKLQKNPIKSYTLVMQIKRPGTSKWVSWDKKTVEPEKYADPKEYSNRSRKTVFGWARKFAKNNAGYAVRVLKK